MLKNEKLDKKCEYTVSQTKHTQKSEIPLLLQGKSVSFADAKY